MFETAKGNHHKAARLIISNPLENGYSNEVAEAIDRHNPMEPIVCLLACSANMSPEATPEPSRMGHNAQSQFKENLLLVLTSILETERSCIFYGRSKVGTNSNTHTIKGQHREYPPGREHV